MFYKDLKSLYRGNIKEITKSVDNWKDYLTFASKVHKYSFDNALLIYLQNKKFTTLATYEQWNKLGRYVNTGATGLKVCQYDNARATYTNLFDISQTNGKKLNITNWNLDDYIKNKLAESYGGADFEDLVASGVVHLTLKKLNMIMEEIKSNQNHIFGQLPEEVIYGELTDVLFESSYYLVSKRCGLSDEEIKLQGKMHSIVDFNNMQLIATLGQAVTSISKSLLLDMERKIKIIDKERNVQNEKSREITKRESREQYTVQTGRGETSIPTSIRDDGRRTKTTNEVWQDGNGTYGGKLSEQINGTETNGRIDESVTRSGRESVQQSFGIDGRIESEQSNAKNGRHVSENKTPKQLETDGRRNSNTRDSFNLSLEEKESYKRFIDFIRVKGFTRIYIKPLIDKLNIEKDLINITTLVIQKEKLYSEEKKKNNINKIGLSPELKLEIQNMYKSLFNESYYKVDNTDYMIDDEFIYINNDSKTKMQWLALKSGVYKLYKEEIENKLESITLEQSEVIDSFSIENKEKAQQTELEKIAKEELKKADKKINNNTKKGRTREHLNFYKLQKLFPEFIDGKYSYLKLKSESSVFMDLVLEKVSDDTISIAHYFEQNGDLMRDPEMTLIINYKKDTVTAESFTQDSIGLYQKVFNEDRTTWKKNLNKELNNFLKGWLSNIENQGYKYYRAIESQTGLEIVLDEEMLSKKDEMFELFKNDLVKYIEINNKDAVFIANNFFEDFKMLYNSEVNKFGSVMFDINDELGLYLRENLNIFKEFREKALTIVYDELRAKEIDVKESRFYKFEVIEKQQVNENVETKNYEVVEEIENLSKEDTPNENEQDYSYLIGKTVKLNGKPFLIDSIEPYDNAVNLEDVELKAETGVPIIREEPIEKILQLLEEEKIENINIDNSIKENEDNDTLNIISNEIEEDYSYLVGKYVELGAKQFIVNKVNGSTVDLEDIEFKSKVGFPIFRTERLETILSLIEEVEEVQTINTDNTVVVNENHIDDLFDNNKVIKVKSVVVEKEETEEIKLQNFKYSDDYNLYPSGEKTKFNNNIQAIQLIRQLQIEKREATKEEQIVLAKYVGWGGLSNAFSETKPNWINENKQLQLLLSNEEYQSAMQSTLTAYYTDPKLIEIIYKGISNLGFDGDKNRKILEPSMGTGNFYSVLPDSFKSKLYGVEIDKMTGSIAKNLYPNANIDITGYQYTNFKNDSFDLIVGNVPFSDMQIIDSNYIKKRSDYKKAPVIHDYFFIKSIDLLKVGGVIAFITSSGTLDKMDSSFRKEIASKCDLLGAIRLPNTAFKEIAKTEVTTDIIFLKKLDRVRDFDFEKLPNWI